MTEEIQKYLHDISVSISAIKSYLVDCIDFSDFNGNRMLKMAIEREFTIIGEAVNRILKIDITIPISNHRKIVSVRNYIVHGYDSVDYETLWSIIKRHLPVLENEVNHLLKK
jgi:uncharacterized protein with HEPN domain